LASRKSEPSETRARKNGISDCTDGALIHVRAIPKASCSELVSIEEDCVVIRLAAPPLEGKANLALIDYLAKRLKTRKSACHLKVGAASRYKTVQVDGLNAEQVKHLLQGEP
jgi:uncharacterized protein (TIGR00251 family)